MKNKFDWFLHGVVNIFLIFIIFACIVVCGFLKNEDIYQVNKTYRGVIYAGNENTNKVALMINVYWGTEYLSDMLDILDRQNVKCTFFVGKTWVEAYPEILKQIYDKGHEIGNHGSNHKEHANLGYEGNVKEIDGCTNAVQNVLGFKMNLFAPPGGSYNDSTVKAADNLGYKTILWTHDTIDWRDRNEDLIYTRATNLTTNGDLILMHPTEATKNVLEKIIITLKSKNLIPDTVSNTIKE